MKKSIIIFTLALLFFIPNILFARIRCGNDLISIGDRAYKVQKTLEQCGEVLDKEVIETTARGTISYNSDTGTSTTNFREDRVKKERWWIRVNEGSGFYCYPLIFDSGTLTEVERWESCN